MDYVTEAIATVDVEYLNEKYRLRREYRRLKEFCSDESVAKLVYYLLGDFKHESREHSIQLALSRILHKLGYSVTPKYSLNAIEDLASFIGYYIHDDGYAYVEFDKNEGEFKVIYDNDARVCQDPEMYIKAAEDYSDFYEEVEAAIYDPEKQKTSKAYEIWLYSNRRLA